jgi:uncharacterized membrane protein
MPQAGRFRTFRRNPRIWTALLLACAVALLLPRAWPFVTRLLVGWDCGVVFLLVSIYVWMRSLSAQQICLRYVEEDPSATFILVVVTAAALLSLIATVQVLATVRHLPYQERIWHLALVALTLIASWLLVPTIFTVHYADMFYSAPPSQRPLHFPQTEMPVFADFAYFSFTIAAASQTADVTTTNRSIRKVLIVHEVISFFFNAAVVGFAINVTAGLIGS